MKRKCQYIAAGQRSRVQLSEAVNLIGELVNHTLELYHKIIFPSRITHRKHLREAPVDRFDMIVSVEINNPSCFFTVIQSDMELINVFCPDCEQES